MISVGFEFRIFATIRSGAYIRTIRLDSNFEYSPLFGRKRIFAYVITIRIRSQVTEYRIFEIRWTSMRITSTIYNMSGRVVSDIQLHALGSILHIRYNTTAHILNSTSLILIILH